MKIKLTIILLLIVTSSIAQAIGINTNTPLSELHINGTLTLTDELKVGGTATSLGNPGLESQVLMSTGQNTSPEWVKLNIPRVEPGALTMTKSLALLDTTGIEIYEPSNKTQYKENELITSIVPGDPGAKWTPIEGLTTSFILQEKENKVNVIIQTIGHISRVGIPTNSNGSYKGTAKYGVAIGVFIDEELKSVKPYKIEGNTLAFTIITLISTIENLTPGEHILKVAIIPRQRQDYTGTLAIGRKNSDKNANNVTNFMARTSLKLDIFELLNK